MAIEVQGNVKYRKGENANQPWGGRVANEPFPRALFNLATKRGFLSQKSLAEPLGVYQGRVGTWYRGERAPGPDNFGQLLILLKPAGADYDDIVDSYGQLLQQGKGCPNPDTKPAVLGSKRRIGSSTTPLGSWFTNFCQNKAMTLAKCGRVLGLGLTGSNRDLLGLYTLSMILQQAPLIFDLTEAETEDLSEAVALTIEQKVAQGHRLKDYGGETAIKMQGTLPYETFNDAQAARNLGVTRHAVFQCRKQHGLPHILNKCQLEILRTEIKR